MGWMIFYSVMLVANIFFMSTYAKGFSEGADWRAKNPSHCPVCKGNPCVLIDTPKGNYISGAHNK